MLKNETLQLRILGYQIHFCVSLLFQSCTLPHSEVYVLQENVTDNLQLRCIHKFYQLGQLSQYSV